MSDIQPVHQTIIIRCRDCEHANLSQFGVPGFELRTTRFHSLTEALEHIVTTQAVGQAHDLYLELEPEQEDY
jgi:hypothetical protein